MVLLARERERGFSVWGTQQSSARIYSAVQYKATAYSRPPRALPNFSRGRTTPPRLVVERSGVLHGVAVQLEASRLQRPLHAPAWPKIGRDCTTTITTTKQGTSRSNTSLHIFVPRFRGRWGQSHVLRPVLCVKIFVFWCPLTGMFFNGFLVIHFYFLLYSV